MMVGRFAPVNRVTRTFLWPGLVHKNLQPNIASLLKEKVGYEVVWKGKWHLSYAVNAAPGNGGEDWTAADITVIETNYGWTEWIRRMPATRSRRCSRLSSGNSTGSRPWGAATPTMTDATSDGARTGAGVRLRVSAKASSIS